MDATGLLPNETRLEEHLRATEALAADRDDVTVGQLVRLLLVGRLSGGLHLCVVVKSDVRELLLYVTNNLTLCRGGEGIAALSENLHHVLCQVAARQIQAQDGMGQCITFVDWNGMRHTVSRVHHDTRGAPGRIQGEHCLNCDIHSRHVEGFKHDLSHPLAIGLRVEWSLSEKNRMLLGCNTKLVIKRVMPDLLHVIPIGHNTMLDWILKSQHTTLALSLITHITVFLVHPDHD